MNRNELMNEIAAKYDIKRADAARLTKDVFRYMMESLSKHGRFTSKGFGTFKVAKRKARVVKHPVTGKKIKVPAQNVVRFKAGKKLKQSLNKVKRKK